MPFIKKIVVRDSDEKVITEIYGSVHCSEISIEKIKEIQNLSFDFDRSTKKWLLKRKFIKCSNCFIEIVDHFYALRPLSNYRNA